LCDRNGLKFEIEINKLSQDDECLFLKFKKTEGNSNIFKEICKSVLMKINV